MIIGESGSLSLSFQKYLNDVPREHYSVEQQKTVHL
jgi:hypothetical protein